MASHQQASLPQVRGVPQTQAQLIDYFLETESGEMQYEAARMRPLLTEDWFKFLANEISELHTCLGCHLFDIKTTSCLSYLIPLDLLKCTKQQCLNGKA